MSLESFSSFTPEFFQSTESCMKHLNEMFLSADKNTHVPEAFLYMHGEESRGLQIWAGVGAGVGVPRLEKLTCTLFQAAEATACCCFTGTLCYMTAAEG